MTHPPVILPGGRLKVIRTSSDLMYNTDFITYYSPREGKENGESPRGMYVSSTCSFCPLKNSPHSVRAHLTCGLICLRSLEESYSKDCGIIRGPETPYGRTL